MRLALVLAAGAALLFACSDSKPAADTAAAVSTPSGLQIVHEREGSGPSPKASDVVKVHYHGTFTDGRVFDSSVHARRAHELPAEPRDPVLDAGAPADEGGRQGEAHLSAGGGVRPARRTAHHPAELDADLRGRAARDRVASRASRDVSGC